MLQPCITVGNQNLSEPYDSTNRGLVSSVPARREPQAVLGQGELTRPLAGSKRRKSTGTSPTLVTSRVRGPALVLYMAGPKLRALAGVMLYLLNTARALICISAGSLLKFAAPLFGVMLPKVTCSEQFYLDRQCDLLPPSERLCNGNCYVCAVSQSDLSLQHLTPACCKQRERTRLYENVCNNQAE